MNTLLSASNISVIRQQKHILNQVSLDIGEHDFITIIGPNGAGKSMLLKCLLGFYQTDDGKITRKKSLKIGYMPQNMHLEPTMPITVQRFLALRIRKRNIQMIIQQTGIKDILHKPLTILSGGQIQRVLLARSLLNQPDLLVLDEPAQNLDVSGQLAFYKLLDQIYQASQISILMVSHDLHMVMASSKRVICLYHHVCCSGEPQVVTKDPEFISLFGDDMSKMMAAYQHNHKHGHRHD